MLTNCFSKCCKRSCQTKCGKRINCAQCASALTQCIVMFNWVDLSTSMQTVSTYHCYIGWTKRETVTSIDVLSTVCTKAFLWKVHVTKQEASSSSSTSSSSPSSRLSTLSSWTTDHFSASPQTTRGKTGGMNWVNFKSRAFLNIIIIIIKVSVLLKITIKVFLIEVTINNKSVRGAIVDEREFKSFDRTDISCTSTSIRSGSSHRR